MTVPTEKQLEVLHNHKAEFEAAKRTWVDSVNHLGMNRKAMSPSKLEQAEEDKKAKEGNLLAAMKKHDDYEKEVYDMTAPEDNVLKEFTNAIVEATLELANDPTAYRRKDGCLDEMAVEAKALELAKVRTKMDAKQLKWLENALAGKRRGWRIWGFVKWW